MSETTYEVFIGGLQVCGLRYEYRLSLLRPITS